jgi:hypothetical protein
MKVKSGCQLEVRLPAYNRSAVDEKSIEE